MYFRTFWPWSGLAELRSNPILFQGDSEEGHEAGEKKAGPAFTGEFQEYLSNWMTVHMTDDNTPQVDLT